MKRVVTVKNVNAGKLYGYGIDFNKSRIKSVSFWNEKGQRKMNIKLEFEVSE